MAVPCCAVPKSPHRSSFNAHHQQPRRVSAGVLHTVGWRAGRRPQAAGRFVRVGMAGIGELLPAQRQRLALSLWPAQAAGDVDAAPGRARAPRRGADHAAYVTTCSPCTQFWQRRTNVWRRITSPRTGAMRLRRRKSGIGNTKKSARTQQQQPLHVLAGVRVSVSNEENEMITALTKKFYERDAQDCARHAERGA